MENKINEKNEKNLRAIIEEIAKEGVAISMRLLENNHGFNYFLISIRGSICGANITSIIYRLTEKHYEFKMSSGDHVLFIETVPNEGKGQAVLGGVA